MIFPDRKYPAISAYLEAYGTEIAKAVASVDRTQLERAGRLLADAIARDAQIFACGNGGSASISNHLACDHSKGISANTDMRPRVHSLSANVATITAIANDIDYAEIFAHQLSRVARSGDALIAISASGNSENVCRALRWARAHGVDSVALTGFDGGAAMMLADVGIHVVTDNYGVAEDVHQSLMHVLAQFIRLAAIDDDRVGKVRF